MKTPSTRTGETTSIPPDILREIESFEEEAAKVLRGELAQDLFRPFRLQHGIYGQRQPGVQMVRIKIPFGGLNSTQCRVIAEMADRYATGVGHVTTRHGGRRAGLDAAHRAPPLRVPADGGPPADLRGDPEGLRQPRQPEEPPQGTDEVRYRKAGLRRVQAPRRSRIGRDAQEP